MAKPNLFNYATSELSQDAFLYWLLDWANPENSKIDQNLCLVAQEFVQKLLRSQLPIHKVQLNIKIKNTDVCAIVNDEYFIIIEDKKGTSEHSNQLQRYSVILSENGDLNHLKERLIYYKMEEQSDLSQVEKDNFQWIDRKIMLGILDTYFDTVPLKLQNHILSDYYLSLKELDKKILSFQTAPVSAWDNYYSWMGFFSELQERFPDVGAGWQYVSNASGGFMGFWWQFASPTLDTPKLYLQIQKGLLTFRMSADSKEKNQLHRKKYQEAILQAAKEYGVDLAKYGSSGKTGKSTGIYKLGFDFLITDNNEILNFDKTVDLLKKVTLVVDKAVGYLVE